MNEAERARFKKGDEKIHKVEDEWHYPILTKFGFKPVDKEAVGFVRQYTYKRGEHTVQCNVGCNADYWNDLTVPSSCMGYWGTLESHLKKLFATV
jgi:hypothetical protein